MIFVNKDIILLNKEYCGDVAFVMKKSPSENGREYMPYEEIKGIVIAVFVLAVVGLFVGDIISRHSKHRKPEKPIPKGRIWQSNDGSLPILVFSGDASFVTIPGFRLWYRDKEMSLMFYSVLPVSTLYSSRNASFLAFDLF